MKTITEKLAIVRKVAAAKDWAENDLRALIHGTGGSPRRAKRVLKADPEFAKTLAETYATMIVGGTAHVHAVRECALMWAATFGTEPATEASEAGEGEPETDEADEADETEAAAPPAKPARRARKTAAGLAAVPVADPAPVAELQPALL